MDLKSWLALVGGVIAAGVVIYGVAILVTGRALRSTQRAFGRLTDAGVYYLCIGLAVLLLAVGALWNGRDQTLPAVATLVVSMVLLGVALLVRYRSGRAEQQ